MPKKKRKPYQFPIPRYRAPDVEKVGAFEFSIPREDEDTQGVIQGKLAGSPEEWRVAVALDTLGRSYMYQYLVGISGMAGSYHVDFVVYDSPKWFPLEIQSVRWHTGAFAIGEDIRTAKIERYFGSQMRYLWEDELQTQADAVAAVKDMLYSPVLRRLQRV